MKRVAIGVLFALLVATAAWGQRVQTNDLSWFATGAPPPSGVTAQATGIRGSVDLYYWVTARYPAGVSIPAGPGRAVGTRGFANLAASPVRVSWPAAPGATGYDVIVLTTPNFPANSTCANCVVASNLNAVTLLNNAAPIIAFPTAGTVFVRSAIQDMVINNRDRDRPFITFNGELNWSPTRSTADFAYLFKIDDGGGSTSGQMTGGAAQKTYAFGITVNRPTSAVATGDSNDALAKWTYNNYAKNDANFIVRGINTVVNNRAPGTLGMLDNLISSSNKSGATSPIVNGLTVNVENFGVNATQHSALDLSLKNEAAKATKEWAIRARNLNNSIGGPSDAVLLVEEPALANTGWNFIIDANGVKSPTKAFARLQNGSVVYYGDSNTRDAVRAEVGLTGGLGSMYLNTLGKIYLKVANANATADWQSLTSVAAD